MSRYFISSRPPKAWNMHEDEPFRPNLTVDDHEAVWTGIVATDGQPFMRAPNPMGFGRDGEW